MTDIIYNNGMTDDAIRFHAGLKPINHKTYWLITYSQETNNHKSIIINKAIDMHPADWLSDRARRLGTITRLHFAMQIGQD